MRDFIIENELLDFISNYAIDENLLFEDDTNNEQAELEEIIKSVVSGKKDQDIKKDHEYQQIENVVNSIAYKNNVSKQKMEVFVQNFIKFLYILSNIKDENAQKIRKQSIETFLKLPNVVSEANKLDTKLSLPQNIQTQIKSLRSELKKVLTVKMSDERKASEMLSELKKKYPNAQNAIQQVYDNTKPKQNNNQQ